MLALVEVVNFLTTFTPIIIVHKNELPGHCIIEIRLSHQSVRTEHDLLFFWNENALVEIVTHY